MKKILYGAAAALKLSSERRKKNSKNVDFILTSLWGSRSTTHKTHFSLHYFSTFRALCIESFSVLALQLKNIIRPFAYILWSELWIGLKKIFFKVLLLNRILLINLELWIHKKWWYTSHFNIHIWFLLIAYFWFIAWTFFLFLCRHSADADLIIP